jgi:hypothetical protein
MGSLSEVRDLDLAALLPFLEEEACVDDLVDLLEGALDGPGSLGAGLLAGDLTTLEEEALEVGPEVLRLLWRGILEVRE